MKMLAASLMALILAASVFAQSKGDTPNLSGTWRLTQSKNEPKRSDQTEETLTIVDDKTQITVTIHMKSNGREDTLKQVFFTDGRGETNPTFGSRMLQTQTKRNGAKLEIRHTDSISTAAPDGDTTIIKLQSVRKWELSKDGNTLTITTLVSGPPGVTTRNADGNESAQEIFSRVP